MSQLKLFIETLPEKGIQEKKIPLITNRNSERKQEVPAVPQEDPVFRMLLLVAHAPTPCSCPLVSILILYHLNYVPSRSSPPSYSLIKQQTCSFSLFVQHFTCSYLQPQYNLSVCRLSAFEQDTCSPTAHKTVAEASRK